MLEVIIPAIEGYDEDNNEFVILEPAYSIQLEHSLASVSKWESKWCKPFYSKKEKTQEEVMDYIKCMTISQNVDSRVYDRLTKDNIDKIIDYIEAPMTATTITDNRNNKKSREIVTAEIIYYWMISLNIPFECQYWHINKLLIQIQVCNIKNTPPKKMSKRDIFKHNAALNAAQKKKFNTRG